MHFRLRLLPATAMPLHFVLHRDWAIAQLAVLPVTANSDFPAVFPCLARETEFHPVVVAVSFAVRSSPEVVPFAVVLFRLCRSPICFATVYLVTAADSFGLVGSDFVVAGSA